MIFALLEGAARQSDQPPCRNSLRANPQRLIHVHFAAAEEIVLVQGQPEYPYAGLALCRLSPPEARRLVERFEWHYTPKHGSWLDMAESELAVLTRQCLIRPIPDKQALNKEVAAWERHQNKHHAKADWQFTTRRRPRQTKRLYPQ